MNKIRRLDVPLSFRRRRKTVGVTTGSMDVGLLLRLALNNFVVKLYHYRESLWSIRVILAV